MEQSAHFWIQSGGGGIEPRSNKLPVERRGEICSVPSPFPPLSLCAMLFSFYHSGGRAYTCDGRNKIILGWLQMNLIWAAASHLADGLFCCDAARVHIIIS